MNNNKYKTKDTKRNQSYKFDRKTARKNKQAQRAVYG